MKKFNTQHPLAGRIRVLFLIAALVLAAGCSTIRFTYNHGDTLLYWWMNTYVDFDSDQSGLVKRDLDRLFAWHRSTQLDDYVAVLGNAQRQLAGNVTAADLLADYQDILARSEKLALKAAPEMAELARTIKPDQIARMEKKFASNNDTYRRKFLKGDNEKKQKVRFEKMMEQLELWFGSFSRDQEAQLRQASDARPLDNQVWLDERMLRQQQILALLRKIEHDKPAKAVAQGQIEQLIRDIFARFRSPERKAFYDAYEAGTAHMVLTAIKIATPEQKAHAQKRMQGWIDDFKTLQAQAR
jgi:membrane carboxypeptidase/penicillin-binding protein PbpC